jgi:hydrogenase maturation protein HypF
MSPQSAYRIHINGIVQGVGFRPFVYSLASRYHLNGWVKNTSGGVEIEVSGSQSNLDQFLVSLESEIPPLAKIDSLTHETIPNNGYDSFQIHTSSRVEGDYQPISPDVSICNDCLSELFDTRDRRFRYPFINCTNCGPRFSIIQDIPYDRPQTTMEGFPLCSICQEEYHDPLNRRFHAQPVACPDCGPQVWLESSLNPGKALAEQNSAIEKAQSHLADGKILAIKGLGGFHLACNAEDPIAVQQLRSRKNRPAKPLAVMMPDLTAVQKHCQLSQQEMELLTSPQRPIILLPKKQTSSLPEELAPGQRTLGVMLPYTPLHYLLFAAEDRYPAAPYQVLVMTSANRRGNPILTENAQVREDLQLIADYYLFHNRDIHVPCDDSVARIQDSQNPELSDLYFIRRSRGYTPQPIRLPESKPPVLGVGAELKNTFCLSKDNYLFLSQHIGDLKNYPTLKSFETNISHFEGLFRTNPELIVSDLHPDYLSSRFAAERAKQDGLPTLSTQHHHAHIASCLADNQYQEEEPVIGVAFDGIGYGDDGLIWGGEFLIADYHNYHRVGHLDYFPLPGGDTAIREPWRTALSLLEQHDLPWTPGIPAVEYGKTQKELFPGLTYLAALEKQLKTGTNAPLTSSIGRLFDGVAALIGICQTITYEGQAAIELEAMADPDEQKSYPFEITNDNLIKPGNLIKAVLADYLNGVSSAIISARFHNSLAEMIREIAVHLRQGHHLSRVALSGGVWQNMTLLRKSILKLEQANFEVFIHQSIPPNDGGIAVGQVVIGHSRLSV